MKKPSHQTLIDEDMIDGFKDFLEGAYYHEKDDCEHVLFE